jgi:hypothetical protein
MAEQNELPPPGWYDDPEGRPGYKRYWDGEAWTDRFEGVNAATNPKVAEINREFKSLHTIAGVFNVLGWLTLTLGTLLVVGGAISAGSQEEARTVFGESTSTDPGASAAVILIVGLAGVLLYSLLFFAAAAFTRLWLRVEDNTFRTAAALDRMAKPEG